MMTASERIYAAAGRPPMESGAPGYCALCGAEARGIAFDDWVSDVFMDFDKLHSGSIVCEACQFTTDDHSLILQAKLKRDKPQRMRNYSHFVVNGEWHALHKGQKGEMFALLMGLTGYDPMPASIIAMSGQKHIVFRAKPGYWQIEEQSMLPERRALAALESFIRNLLRCFAKSEIESGVYAQHRIVKYGIEEWSNVEDALKRYRGSLVFQLAVWLSQKENDGPEA